MSEIRVTFPGMDKLLRNLSQHAEQIPYATELAINATASGVLKAAAATMRSEFDRPTPFVAKGLYIDRAQYKPGKLWAEVRVKDAGPAPLAETIGQQFAGGSGRARKRIEKAFERAGYISAAEYLVPGPDAVLNQYGNLDKKQSQQIYAALTRLNPTPGKRKRKNKAATAAASIFWSPGRGKGSKLRRGLWATDAAGNLQLILVVVAGVKYRRRIDLREIAERVVRRDFGRNFDIAFRRAIATAR